MIGRLDPSVADRLKEWEILVKDASKLGAATFFAADTTPEGRRMAMAGHPGPYPDAHAVFDWSKTTRGGFQYDLIKSIGACASEYGMCE
jgi:hypothetical protein